MTVTLLLLAVMAVSGIGLWRLLRRQTPHPMEDRRTVEWDELHAMWARDGGIE